jgi:hypothetical protein
MDSVFLSRCRTAVSLLGFMANYRPCAISDIAQRGGGKRQDLTRNIYSLQSAAESEHLLDGYPNTHG